MIQRQRDPKVCELVNRLRSVFDPCTIYLFGSWAKGTAQATSDYDVMVVVPHTDESHPDRYVRGRLALRHFGVPVDLLVYTQREWDEQSPKRYSVARQVRDTGVMLHAA